VRAGRRRDRRGTAVVEPSVRIPTLAGDDGYPAEVIGFDLSVPQQPAVVIGATGAADVLAGFRFALTQGLGVGAIATGHGPMSPADGAVLINTRRMDGVLVDPDRRTALVQAGATWLDVIHESASFGLAPLCGASPLVGVVSYCLGGGLGPLGRRYGFAADHVHRLEVVTADGESRSASAEENPDLFWALRGGGGNVGLVTAIEIGLVEVAELYGGGLFFDGEDAPAVLPVLLEVMKAAPDELTLSVAIMTFPDLPEVAAPIRGRHVCHVRVAHCGSERDGVELVAPLRAAAHPLLDTVQTIPFSAVGTIHADPTTARAVHSTTMGPASARRRTRADRAEARHPVREVHGRTPSPRRSAERTPGRPELRRPPRRGRHRLRDRLSRARELAPRGRRGVRPHRRPGAVERRRRTRQLPRWAFSDPGRRPVRLTARRSTPR